MIPRRIEVASAQRFRTISLRFGLGRRLRASLIGCMAMAGVAAAAELQEVTLQLKWYHQFQFAGYYAAEAKGFYREEGLAVRILEGAPTRPPIPTVLEGGADFGVSDSELVLARMQGKPVKVCAAIFQHSPYVIISRRERGIRAPNDLRGKRVMLAEDQGAAQFRGMLIREGVSLGDVSVVKHSWNLDDLIEGRADAISGYAMVEPVRLRARGVDASLMRALDYGIDFYGDALFSTDEQVRKHPERVEKFVRASLRGWEYAMRNPEEIADMIVRMDGVVARGDTREIILEHARGMRDYVLPEVVEIGHMNPGRWQQIARVFDEAQMAPKTWSLDGFVFNPHPASDPESIRRIIGFAAGSLALAALGLLWNVQMRRQVRRRTEESRQSEAHFRSVVEQAGEGIFICEPDGRCLTANKAGCEMLGHPEEVLQQMTMADITLPEDAERLASETAYVLSGGLLQSEWHVRRKDGTLFTAEVNSTVRSDGKLQIFVRDVTERDAAARRQARLQRTVRTISEANSLIVRATDEEQLLKDFCERMVQQTGHRVIWVGFVDERTREVRLVAKGGPAVGYLDGIRISADENDLSGRGPSGVCIRTGRVVNCGSFASSSQFAPWRDRAARMGLRCSISLPLRVDGHVIGAFTLYSDVENRFDEEEERLLGELADDLSYAIGALRQKRWLRIISQAVEHSPAMVIITDSEGTIEYVNARFTQLTGYTGDEALGKNPRILNSGMVKREVYELLWQTIKSGREWQGELLNRKKNGELYWEYSWISPVSDAGGRTTRFIAIKEDITDRKQGEERVRAQLARTGLLNAITRAIGERTNLDTMLSVVATSLEEHLPVDFSALFLAEEGEEKFTATVLGPRARALIANAGSGSMDEWPIASEGVAHCRNGELMYEPDLASAKGHFPAALARTGLGSAILVPLALSAQICGMLVAGRQHARGFSEDDCDFLRQLADHVALAVHQARLLADLQQANEELRNSREAALQQERLRALGTMASGVAHDINNAISPVSIYCDLMQQNEPNLSPESKDFLRTIQNAIQDVAGTVSRLRQFYRKRDEQMELLPVSLDHVAKEVVKLTRARWVDMPQERGIVIDMELQLAQALPQVSGVESEIREAIINLVFNAVDAMPAGGKLTIRTALTEENPPRALIEVGDTGIGMDGETRRRCIEPFFTTKGERGTGLGLAMVCGIAQRHDAEIAIESALGAGTMIRLLFPVPKAALLKRAPVDPPPKIQSLRVLVVDDDPLITKALDFGLQVDGHTVAVANGGQEGIDRFNEVAADGAPFDAVITDLGMPHVDGRQVAAAVKAASPSTPVILLTGWGQRLIDSEEIPNHVDRVLSKPPRLREVREALAAVRGAPQDSKKAQSE